jgi:hypothetical protein
MLSHEPAVVSIRTMARTGATATGSVIRAGTSLTQARALNSSTRALPSGNGDQGPTARILAAQWT